MLKIIRKNCCGLDVYETWIFACIGITDSLDCTDVCMKSTGKYWIPVYNILEKITYGLFFLILNTQNL